MRVSEFESINTLKSKKYENTMKIYIWNQVQR